MPGPMPGYVTKGKTIAKLDTALNDTTAGGAREQLRKRLAARQANGTWTEGVVDVMAAVLGLDPAEKAHLKKHWFDERAGWWASQQPTDIVVRHGLIHVIDVADGKVKAGDTRIRPVDCYWICGIPSLAITACMSKSQVTAFVMTPAPPVSDRVPADYGGNTQTDDIYTIRHQSRGPGEREVKLATDWVEFIQPLHT